MMNVDLTTALQIIVNHHAMDLKHLDNIVMDVIAPMDLSALHKYVIQIRVVQIVNNRQLANILTIVNAYKIQIVLHNNVQLRQVNAYHLVFFKAMLLEHLLMGVSALTVLNVVQVIAMVQICVLQVVLQFKKLLLMMDAIVQQIQSVVQMFVIQTYVVHHAL